MSQLEVVALGGNAILPQEGAGTIEEQFALTRESMRQVADRLAAGRRVVLTHGNGPIVGNIVVRNEAVRDRIPPMPLDVCGADSQGGIGYMIQQTLRNELIARSLDSRVITVVTQVEVDAADPAFRHPTKPIGPYYKEEEAERLRKEKGWVIGQDANRGLRRMVPSPRPVEIVEIDMIASLVESGVVVIAAGGGGIPVIREDGRLRGAEAVIDKDRAASVMARSLGASTLFILTDVEQVSLNFGSPDERPIDRLDVSECRRLLDEGQFPPGSMGPKVESAADFVVGGGELAWITHVHSLGKASRGETGTKIVPDA